MDLNLGEAMLERNRDSKSRLDYWPPHDEDVNYIRISHLCYTMQEHFYPWNNYKLFMGFFPQ